jgi:mannosyltransferase
MALPKSMRFLAAVTLCIFFYMLVLIYKAPSEIQAPSKTPPANTLQEWDHDPQLDRMLQTATLQMNMRDI